jgi:hypothetical protein
MDYRGVLLIGAVVGAGAVASSTACTAPDPGAITFAERESQGTSEPQGSSGTSGTSGTAADGGGGADTGAPPDPIFGTTPFAYVDPGVAANGANDAHGGTVEGKDCREGCHVEGGVAAAKPWVYGGTVYTAAQGGQTVPKAEIKVVGPNGEDIGSTYTDANGNFWLEKDGTTIPAGSKVGVRKEGGRTMFMATPLQPGDSGCNANRANCHGTPATGKVYAL